MKKAIFFFAFFLAFGIVGANAQACSGAAAASKACCSSKASKAAATDASIEKRQAEDGTVAYVRKEADAQGNVQFVSVQYDEASNAFVNVAPKSATTATSTEGKVKKSCTPSETKACAGAAAAGSGKACCAKPANGAGCDKKAQ